jgi:putative nucleotidyltransferase with HDIG domain
MHNLETLLEQSEELPSLPEIYTRVSELIESDNSTARQIGEAVQTDASLTSRVLKMINSAYYGLPNEVTSIAQAISYLGHQELKQILLGSVLAGVFNELKSVNFPLLDFWTHSIKTAIIARHLAMQNINIIDHEAFFTAGLLHDIGRLVIANAAPDALADIDDIVSTTGIDILQVETDQLGITHTEVGAALMKKWRMPSLLIQCVQRHHEVNHIGPFAIDTSIVYLANQLSKLELIVDIEDDEELEEMQAILSNIPNWQNSACTLEQISIACELAEEQAFSVMESLGMNDMQIEDDYF